MPLVDPPLLERLVAARDTEALATPFRHADGTPEPLCTIWEPKASAALAVQQRTRGSISLRQVLTDGPAKLIELDDDERLSSANTPADDARIRRRLAALAADRRAPH